jgi:hypothetical protein
MKGATQQCRTISIVLIVTPEIQPPGKIFSRLFVPFRTPVAPITVLKTASPAISFLSSRVLRPLSGLAYNAARKEEAMPSHISIEYCTI